MKRTTHVLASALAGSMMGWYLLEPPATCYPPGPQQGNTLVISQACNASPLSQWVQVDGAGTYDRAADCIAAKGDYQTGYMIDLTGAVLVSLLPPNSPPEKPPTQAQVLAGQHDRFAAQHLIPYRCIATDDPRLKGE